MATLDDDSPTDSEDVDPEPEPVVEGEPWRVQLQQELLKSEQPLGNALASGEAQREREAVERWVRDATEQLRRSNCHNAADLDQMWTDLEDRLVAESISTLRDLRRVARTEQPGEILAGIKLERRL